MKNCISTFVLMVLFTAVPLVAQKPVQDLPELQEWYSWSGAQGAHISYLPNFDIDNGGKNAITQKRENNPTWYNRFAYDTTNKFTWASSWRVTPVDFNGDGILDYIDAAGNVYQGIKKNSPPVRVIGVSYAGLLGGGFVGDFNNDGFNDVVTPNEYGVFTMLFGGKDFTKLKSARVNMPVSAFAQWTGVSAYINELGKPRFISFRRDNNSEGFLLFGLTFEGSPNDSVIVSLKELTSVIETKTDKNQELFFPTLSGLYSNPAIKEYTFLLAAKNQKMRIYSLINDVFVLKITENISAGPLYFLHNSIDGDTVPDIASVTLYKDNPEICIFSNSPLFGFKPRAVLKGGRCSFVSEVYYIGDVTGDGIGDIALGEDGCFSVYKGVNLQTTNVVDESYNLDFSLHQTEPNPIGIDGKGIIPITLVHNGIYILEVFDMTGKRLGELFKGNLPSGEVRLPFDVKALNLGSGMYTLRLSDGKHSKERAFIIHH